MKTRAILNRDGGTLKTADVDALAVQLGKAFARAGHAIDVEQVSGGEMIAALRQAGDDNRIDAIVAAGGDGTVSAAAEIAWKSEKVLGVLPAGTMNLFARSLLMPLDLDRAVSALAWGQVIDCDIASANGKSFVHHFSVGLQPRVISERDQTQYNSRLGKLVSGASVAVASLAQPPDFPAVIASDGTEIERDGSYSIIAVSNNPFGDALLPFADRLNRGVLGLYRTGVLTPDAYVRLAGDMLSGALNDSAELRFSTARKIGLTFPDLKDGALASIDGELVPLAAETEILMHAGALKVLTPTGEAGD